MERKAGNLGVSDRVRFLGQRNDASRIYQAFDVFCLPSLYEGLGIVTVEAQVSGLPCILSTEVPHEAYVAGMVQFLPISDPTVWADTLTKMESGARIDVRREDFEDYDIDHAANKLAVRYLELAGETR